MARDLEQHRILHAFRGAEYAFAIPDGDLDVLAEVIGWCCDIWNGANSLLIPVTADGSYPPYVEQFLELRPIDQMVIHTSLPDGTDRVFGERFGHDIVSVHWERLLANDLHPLNLQPSFQRGSAPEGRPPLPIPAYDDDALARIARVVWGRLDPEDDAEFREAFLLEQHEGEASHFALVDGQVRRTSPLGQTTYMMPTFEQTNPIYVRQLYVLDDASFDELVLFWNLRARSGGIGDEIPVIGVPRAALAFPDRLRSLLDWAQPSLYSRTRPDIYVVASEEAQAEAGHALEGLGLQCADDDEISHSFGVFDQPQSLQFSLNERPLLGGQLRRGVHADALVDLGEGDNRLRLEPSSTFRVRHSGHVRLDLLRLPHPFPWTNQAASAALNNARGDGKALTFTTDATTRALHLDLRLPSRTEALAHFLSSKGLEGEPSSAGRWAQALLSRLPDLTSLDALADARALALLDALTPLSRKKATQRLERALRELLGQSAPNADQIELLLKEHLILLELRALTLAEISSQAHQSVQELLPVLPGLLDADFVRRGAKLACPECSYEEFHTLGELDERVTCPACRSPFLYPATSPGGHHEARLYYRLDGLMARVMDQDLLPVLLSLRKLAPPSETLSVCYWPGIEIRGDNLSRECDLLVAASGLVTTLEAKRRAEALKIADAEATVALAQRLGARCVFAALEGEYATDVVEYAESNGAQLLRAGDLLV
jgi:hypothetical protein